MRPRDGLQPWLLGSCAALLVLGIALAGAGAHAFEPGVSRVSAMAARPSADRVPTSMDDAPCISCYVAPNGGLQGPGGGEGKAALPPCWQVHAVALPVQTWWFDGGGRTERVPVRIAFCRWLD